MTTRVRKASPLDPPLVGNGWVVKILMMDWNHWTAFFLDEKYGDDSLRSQDDALAYIGMLADKHEAIRSLRLERFEGVRT